MNFKKILVRSALFPSFLSLSFSSKKKKRRGLGVSVRTSGTAYKLDTVLVLYLYGDRTSIWTYVRTPVGTTTHDLYEDTVPDVLDLGSILDLGVLVFAQERRSHHKKS